MWVIAMYDLPMGTPALRHAYSTFHTKLGKLGYEQMQFSVYRRFVGSPDRVNAEIARLTRVCPRQGRLSVLTVTEKQMGRVITILNNAKHKENTSPDQMVLL